MEAQSRGPDPWEATRLTDLGWTPRVLVIDDSMTRRTFVVDWLAEQGCKVDGFGDGQRALASLYRLKPDELPDLVLTDVRMPNMGGLELALGLKRDPRFAGIGVVLFSGSPADAVEAGGGGADAELAEAARGLGPVVGLDGLPLVIAEKLRARRA